MRAALEEHRRSGLTPKNLKLVRQVLTDGIWSEVLNLPTTLMSQAHGLKDYAPVKAAVTVQLAVAIAVLTVAPVRLGNLTRIRLEENLIRPGGLSSPYWLVFPHYDVKNQVDLNFKLDKYLTELIDEYVHHFRPILLRGANQPWLFPGESGGFKGLATLSDQITATGLQIDRPADYAASVSARGRSFLPQTSPRRLRNRATHPGAPQHTNHHQLLLRSRNHTGDRQIRKSGSQTSQPSPQPI